MEHLRHKLAFITGAASGIGLGIARACINAGMKVVIADIREAQLQAAAAQLAAGGGVVLPMALDVTNRQQWAACAERVGREFGTVDLLCSNAGVNFVGPTQAATYEDWDFALGVNLGGTVNAVRTFAAPMCNSGRGGHIVITASVCGLFSGAGTGVYAASKYALVGLAESLRADLMDAGVGCIGAVSGAGQVGNLREHAGGAARGACGQWLSPPAPSGGRADRDGHISNRADGQRRSGNTCSRGYGATTCTSSLTRRFAPCSKRGRPRCCALCRTGPSAPRASRLRHDCWTHRCTRQRSAPRGRRRLDSGLAERGHCPAGCACPDTSH